ncbi:hypothetical protein L484_004844 [Morus notabilis]|uniref:Uncharacterized protein n=1 Tax=Morus notabilis TaxID=981085 RepID=W9S2M9_9ROSA|nr:hypothetical protein L484_004844 [Morus notabilis]
MSMSFPIGHLATWCHIIGSLWIRRKKAMKCQRTTPRLTSASVHMAARGSSCSYVSVFLGGWHRVWKTCPG